MSDDMQGNIKRPILEERIVASLSEFPVTVLVGARQVGKTTLAREGAAEFPLHERATAMPLAGLSSLRL
jgi:predicted AAA+ superfamily ATPase